ADALGALRCDVGGNLCKPADDTCVSSSQCCSGDCAPDPAGINICAANGGCQAVGSTCTAATQCCTLFCDATGHCATGQLCKVQSAACTTNAECCDNNCAGPAGSKTCQSTVSGGCSTLGE